jgi:hypothetical protein
MKWQPFIQFRTGHDQGSWDRLTAEEQKAAYRATGKQRKAPKLAVVQEDDGEEYLIAPAFAFPVRLVSIDELMQMPVYQKF